jgi:hypothetical protein
LTGTVHALHTALLAGVVFRNFKHGGMSVSALKQFYVEKGLLEAADSPVDLAMVHTVEEMCELLDMDTVQFFETKPVAEV